MDKKKKGILHIVVGVVIIAVGIFWMGGEEGNIKKEVVGQTDVASVKGYEDMSVDDLASSLNNKDFILINVHVPYIGDIEGTDESIPFDEIAENLDKLPQDKEAKLVLYCQSGRMSEIALETLVGLGFTDVYNLSGGMREWQKRGYQLVRS